MHDPVTGKPSSHAVLWMESNQRALDLVQVHVKIVAMVAGLLWRCMPADKCWGSCFASTPSWSRSSLACQALPALLWNNWPCHPAHPWQNLREMVYLLNGTPRAVDASLAVPGGRALGTMPLTGCWDAGQEGSYKSVGTLLAAAR